MPANAGWKPALPQHRATMHDGKEHGTTGDRLTFET